MMTEVSIRHETVGEHEAISGVVYAAFLNHPQHAPGSLPTEHKIVDSLRESGALTLSLVYEDRGEIIGHIAFSPVLTNGEMQGWYGLGPVAVLPDRQREGIGSALIREGMRLIEEKGAAGVVLVGDPAYYGRFGFVSRPELVMDGVPTEYVLSLPIANGIPSGKVAFHDAFSVS
jgi:putative acetyltransferase